MENAAMLAKKLLNETARGVLCLISRMGITGYTATLVSTITKITTHTPLADMSPHISGCDQGSSSVDFRDKPSSKHPTVRTSVNDPKKSIRCSLVRRVKERTSSGSGILTLIETSTIDIARIGAYNRLEISGQDSSTRVAHYLPETGRLISWQIKYLAIIRGSPGKQTYQPNLSLSHPPSGPPRPAPAPKRLEK